MSIQIRNYKNERSIIGGDDDSGMPPQVSGVEDLNQRQPAIISELMYSDVGNGSALIVKDYYNNELIVPAAEIDSQYIEGKTVIDLEVPAINNLLESDVPNEADWFDTSTSVSIDANKRYKISYDKDTKKCKLIDTISLGPLVLAYQNQGDVQNASPLMPAFDFYNKTNDANISAINVKNIPNMPQISEDISVYVYAFIYRDADIADIGLAWKDGSSYTGIPTINTRWKTDFRYMETINWNMGKQPLMLNKEGIIETPNFKIPKDSMCIVTFSTTPLEFQYRIQTSLTTSVFFEGNLMEKPYHPTEQSLNFTGNGYLYNDMPYIPGYVNRPVYRPKMKDIQDPPLRYLVESYQEDGWQVRKFSNGDAECWKIVKVQVNLSSCGFDGINKSYHKLTLPSGLFNKIPVVTFGKAQSFHDWCTCGAVNENEYEIAYFQTNLNANNSGRSIQIRAEGTWK